MGLIITFGLYRLRSTLLDGSSSQPVPNQVKSTKTSTDEVASAELSVLNPIDGLVTEEKEVTVTGSTTQNSYVVLFVGDTEYISTADETGNFSFTVELENNSNVLTVYSINESGTVISTERVVFVTNAFSNPETTKDESEEVPEESP